MSGLSDFDMLNLKYVGRRYRKTEYRIWSNI